MGSTAHGASAKLDREIEVMKTLGEVTNLGGLDTGEIDFTLYHMKRMDGVMKIFHVCDRDIIIVKECSSPDEKGALEEWEAYKQTKFNERLEAKLGGKRRT